MENVRCVPKKAKRFIVYRLWSGIPVYTGSWNDLQKARNRAKILGGYVVKREGK